MAVDSASKMDATHVVTHKRSRIRRFEEVTYHYWDAHYHSIVPWTPFNAAIMSLRENSAVEPALTGRGFLSG